MPDVSNLFRWLGGDSSPFDIKYIYRGIPEGIVLDLYEVGTNPDSSIQIDVPATVKVVSYENGNISISKYPHMIQLAEFSVIPKDPDDGSFSGEELQLHSVFKASINLAYLQNQLGLDGLEGLELKQTISSIFYKNRETNWVGDRWAVENFRGLDLGLASRVDTNAIKSALKPPPRGLRLKIVVNGVDALQMDPSDNPDVYELIGYVDESRLYGERTMQGFYPFSGTIKLDPSTARYDRFKLMGDDFRASFNSSHDYVYIDGGIVDAKQLIPRAMARSRIVSPEVMARAMARSPGSRTLPLRPMARSPDASNSSPPTGGSRKKKNTKRRRRSIHKRSLKKRLSKKRLSRKTRRRQNKSKRR